MKHIGDNDSQSDFISVLRMTSGQESEPDFVLVEHAYALPWNSQSETALAQPRKTLFLSKLPRATATGSNDEYIDVERLSCDSSVLPYNVEKGRHLMKECERHVVFAKLSQAVPTTKESEDDDDSDNDWVEKVNRNGWTKAQNNLFSSITKVLDCDYLAKLTLQNTDNEPVKQRAIIDKTSGKFTQTMSRIGWDMKLAQWLHNILLQHMSTQYIASYLDILQTLKSKIPTLIDKMISNSFSQKRPNFEALNLLLKRPWDPVSPIFNQFKPLKMENQPIVIHVPSGAGMPNVPLNLRRFRFFNIQLQHLVKYVSMPHTSDTNDGITVLDSIVTDVRKKILEYKEQYPIQPIVLLGWGVGALLACHISLVEKVSANICLGFPMKTFDGMRGGSNDPLLGMMTPTLFVIGQNSTDVTIDSVEEFRQQLQTQTSFVVIAGGGNLMKVSADKCYSDGITQSMVDRCIVDEIGEFLTRVFNEDNNNKEPSAMLSGAASYVSSGSTSTAFTNPLPPKTNRQELPRKRKLSPSNFSDSGNIQSSSKIQRTTETRTAISQNLGLKIPVGVSSVIPLLKSEKNLPMSSPSSHVHFSLAAKGISSMTDAPLAVSDTNVKRRQSGMLKDLSSSFRIQSGSESNASDLGLTKTVTSSFDSCTLSTGSSSPMATIALGALASVSRQKYQRMIQISDSSDVAFSDNKHIYEWNPKPSGKVDSDVGIVGINSVASVSSGNRAFDSPSEFHVPDSEVKPVPQQNQRQYNQMAAKSTGMDSSQILVTSSLINTPPVQKGRRGRPAKNKGLTSYRPIKAMIPPVSSSGKPFFLPAVSQQNTEGASKERSSMAVLTLTGNAGDGTGVEAAGIGISSLGRGVLTLAKGGTSTVRVYSASSHKHSTTASASSNFAQPLQKTARGSLLFTNITASPSAMNKVNEITTISQSSLKSTSVIKRSNLPSSTGQISLNLQGISASRSLTASRNVSALNTTNLGVSRPTVMILTNASREDTSKNNVSSTTTTTTISSSGVKTTKSVIGLRMTVPTMKSNFDILPESGDNLPLESNLTFPLQGSSELDLLASAASELYRKENVNVVLQEPSFDNWSESNTNTINEHKNSKNDNKVTLLSSESSSKLAPSTIKSNITFISAKSINKPSFVKDTLTPLLPRQSAGMQSYSSCSSHKVPSAKTSSFRLIRTLGNPQPTMFKTATVGTTSTGKIVTKTFSVNNTNTGMATGKLKRTTNFGRSYADAETRSRGTSTDFHYLDNTYQTTEFDNVQKAPKKYTRNINENSQKVKKSVKLATNLYNKSVSLKQSNLPANELSTENLTEETIKRSTELNTIDDKKTVEATKYSNTDEICINDKSSEFTSMPDAVSVMKIRTSTTDSNLVDKNKPSFSSVVSGKLPTEIFYESSCDGNITASQSTPLVTDNSSKKCSLNPVIRVTTSSKQSNQSVSPNSLNSSQSSSISTLVTDCDSSTSLQSNLSHMSPLMSSNSLEAALPLGVLSKCTDSFEAAKSVVQVPLSLDVVKTLKSKSLEEEKVFSNETMTTELIPLSAHDKVVSPASLDGVNPTLQADSDLSADDIDTNKQLTKIPDKITPSKEKEKNNPNNKSRLRIRRSVSKSPAEKGRLLRSNLN